MRISALFLTLGLAASTTGCLSSIILNGTIKSTRKASVAFNSIGDYDLAKRAASTGLVQFEGFHVLAPDNEDALFLLLRSWMSYGYAFAEDDYEAARDADDDDLSDYHKGRALMAYNRAIKYGTILLNNEAEGFDTARKNASTVKTWLDQNFDEKEDAELIFWMGYAWLARVNIAKDEPAYVAELFVGVAFLEKSLQLDPTFQNYGATAALAAYHSRSPLAELDQGKDMFEKSIAGTDRKSLLNLAAYATRYACTKGDKALYEKLLKEVVEKDDSGPEFDGVRLSNAVAKHRAHRALGRKRMMDCGFDLSSSSETKSEPMKTEAPKTEAPKTETKAETPKVEVKAAPGASAKAVTPKPPVAPPKTVTSAKPAGSAK